MRNSMNLSSTCSAPWNGKVPRPVKPLFPGARVALIAPSGPVPEERLQPAEEAVRYFGLEPVTYESCRARHGYLAGGDDLRARDVNQAFLDPTIDGILCIRGGYGAQRFLDQLDYDAIREHPKFFAGYSDVTALHTVLNQICGFCTYHTPMPSTELYKVLSGELDGYTLESFRSVLFEIPSGPVKNPPEKALRSFSPGKAQGILCGGNLSLVSSSFGTPWEIDTRGSILFLEDVDESPYRIDRMLTQMRNAGKFRDCAGILLGWWTDCDACEEGSLSLEEVLRELLPQNIPILENLACGHSLPTMSLPLGAMVEMDADTGEITFLQGAES